MSRIFKWNVSQITHIWNILAAEYGLEDLTLSFSLHYHIQIAPDAYPASVPGVNRPEAVADHLPPSRAEIRKACVCFSSRTSSSHISLLKNWHKLASSCTFCCTLENWHLTKRYNEHVIGNTRLGKRIPIEQRITNGMMCKICWNVETVTYADIMASNGY